MIKMYFFKRCNNFNENISMVSYILISALSAFLAIIVVIGAIYYFNGARGHYDGGYTLKVLKLIFISGFFAILYSSVTFYFDKRKVKGVINEFKHEYNNMDCDKGMCVTRSMDEKSIPDTLKEIKKRQVHDRELRELNIQSISVTVTGINMRRMEYRVFCISMYSSERSENIYFNFYTINSGDLMLRNIEYSVDIGQVEV